MELNNNHISDFLLKSLRASQNQSLEESDFQIARVTRLGHFYVITPIDYEPLPTISQIKELAELIRSGNFALYSQNANHLHVNAKIAEEIGAASQPATFKIDTLKQGLLNPGNQNDELKNVEIRALDSSDIDALELAVFNLEMQTEFPGKNKVAEEKKNESERKLKAHSFSSSKTKTAVAQKKKSYNKAEKFSFLKIQKPEKRSRAESRRKQKEKESKLQKQFAERKWENYEMRQDNSKLQALDFELANKEIKSSKLKTDLIS